MRAKDVNAEHVVEALRRSKFKFPGRQKILKSTKWGFTQWDRDEYVTGRQNKWLAASGNLIQYVAAHGRMTEKHCAVGRFGEEEKEEEE